MADIVLGAAERQLIKELKAIKTSCDEQIKWFFNGIEATISFLKGNNSPECESFLKSVDSLRKKVEIFQDSLNGFWWAYRDSGETKLKSIGWCEFDSQGKKKAKVYEDDITSGKILYAIGKWECEVSKSALNINNAVPNLYEGANIGRLCIETERKVAAVVRTYAESERFVK